MLGFNPTFKLSELESKINIGYFDEDIKEYLLELITDGEVIKNASHYFDITIEYDNEDGNCFLYPGDSKSEISKLCKKEKDLLNLFESRINNIYASLLSKDKEVPKMNDLEDRLNEKIKSLYEILEKYNELNRKTKYRYNWRVRGIEDQLDALEQLRDNKDNNWNECYEEDFKESKEV